VTKYVLLKNFISEKYEAEKSKELKINLV